MGSTSGKPTRRFRTPEQVNRIIGHIDEKAIRLGFSRQRHLDLLLGVRKRAETPEAKKAADAQLQKLIEPSRELGDAQLAEAVRKTRRGRTQAYLRRFPSRFAALLERRDLPGAEKMAEAAQKSAEKPEDFLTLGCMWLGLATRCSEKSKATVYWQNALMAAKKSEHPELQENIIQFAAERGFRLR